MVSTMVKFWVFMASIALAYAGPTKETWIVQEETWNAALDRAGMTAEYAKEVLARAQLVTLVFQDVVVGGAERVERERVRVGPVLLADEGVVSIYYAGNPRVRNHIWVVLNRPVGGLADVTEDEAACLRKTVNKVQGVLKDTFGIGHSVVAQWNERQFGQSGFTVAVIPPRGDSKDEHNLLDKVRCNNHVIFGGQRDCGAVSVEERAEDVEAWRKALAEAPEREFSQQVGNDPMVGWIQKQTHRIEAGEQLINWLYEILSEQGVSIERRVNAPIDVPDTFEAPKSGCAFCNREVVIASQLVYESEFCYVLYNFKPASPGAHFLILPKRHVRASADLREDEVRDMHNLAARLTKVLQEKTGRADVKMYIQDGSSVGKTVDHAHAHLMLTPSEVRYMFFSINYEMEKSLSKEELRMVMEDIGKRLAG